MKILFRKPINKPLQAMEIEDGLKPLQKLVGGYVKLIPIADEIVCLCDEEGGLKDLGNNFFHDTYGWIVGNCIFCSTVNNEFASLTDKQIKYVSKYIGFPVEAC